MFKTYRPLPRQDSISRLIAPVSMVADRDDTTEPRRQGSQGVNVMLTIFVNSENSSAHFFKTNTLRIFHT
jgi:hypothetical protein